MRRVGVKIVPIRSEVIVDDVEEDHQTALMRGVDQLLQPFGPAIGHVRRIEQNAVIAPAARAGELSDGTKLDRRHARRREMIETTTHAVEIVRVAECADVKLVEDGLFPRSAAPVAAPVDTPRDRREVTGRERPRPGARAAGSGTLRPAGSQKE